jgi:pimeloyl-ACP methyl ester carboxylesterase
MIKTTSILFIFLFRWRVVVVDGFLQRQQSQQIMINTGGSSSSLSLSSSSSSLRLPLQLSITSMDDLTFDTPDTSDVQEEACIDAATKMKRMAVPVSKDIAQSGSVGISYIHWPASKKMKRKLVDTPPLILLHGFDSSCLEYRRIGPELAEQGIDTYAVDILGWGFTQLDDVTSFSADAKIQALKSFVKSKFGVNSSFCVAGASLGGAAAIELAAALSAPPDSSNDGDGDDKKQNYNEDETPTCAGLILIDAQGFVDGVGPMALLPKPLAKIGVGVLRSVPLRNMANQMSYYDKETFATEDAQVIGRLHCLRDGWSDAMVRWVMISFFFLSPFNLEILSYCCRIKMENIDRL